MDGRLRLKSSRDYNNENNMFGWLKSVFSSDVTSDIDEQKKELDEENKALIAERGKKYAKGADADDGGEGE